MRRGTGDLRFCGIQSRKSLAGEGWVEIVVALVLPLDVNCRCWQSLWKVCEEQDVGDDDGFRARTGQNEIFLSFT